MLMIAQPKGRLYWTLQTLFFSPATMRPRKQFQRWRLKAVEKQRVIFIGELQRLKCHGYGFVLSVALHVLFDIFAKNDQSQASNMTL